LIAGDDTLTMVVETEAAVSEAAGLAGLEATEAAEAAADADTVEAMTPGDASMDTVSHSPVRWFHTLALPWSCGAAPRGRRLMPAASSSTRFFSVPSARRRFLSASVSLRGIPPVSGASRRRAATEAAAADAIRPVGKREVGAGGGRTDGRPVTEASYRARTAQALRPRISMAASSRARYHARCTHALAGREHSHIACQTARAPRPRISIAASSRARGYHARCTRALAGHVLTRQNTQSCNHTACSFRAQGERGARGRTTRTRHGAPEPVVLMRIARRPRCSLAG
jgi:hypothetical protein